MDKECAQALRRKILKRYLRRTANSKGPLQTPRPHLTRITSATNARGQFISIAGHSWNTDGIYRSLR